MERMWYLYKVTRQWKIENNSGIDYIGLNYIIKIIHDFMEQDVYWEGLSLVWFDCRVIYYIDKLSISSYYVSPSYKTTKFLYTYDGTDNGRIGTKGIRYSDEIIIKELISTNIEITLTPESNVFLWNLHGVEVTDYYKVKAADVITNIMKRFIRKIKIKKKALLSELYPIVLTNLILKYIFTFS